MRATARRHVAVVLAIWRQALRRDAQFRAQAWTTGVVALAELVVGLVPVLVISASTDGINGWSPRLMIAVTGCFQITSSLLATVVAPNLLKLDGYVREGELDGMLLRPLDAQWLTTFRWVSPAALTGAAGGIALVVIGVRGSAVDPLGVVVALGWLVCGVVMVTLFWANLAYLAFWFEAASYIHHLVNEVLSAGRYPVTLFPHLIRGVLVFVVPIGVATTLPVQAMTGTVSPGVAVGVLAVLLGGSALTRLHWTVALRRYASASS